MGIVVAILIFCVLIITHEFGHLIVAKLNGVYCHEFAIGMGPKITSVKKSETEYVIRAFPIGGMVKMMGEDEDSNDPRAFNQKKVWQRASIIFAGPAMNLLTACVVFAIAFMGIGVASDSNIIGDVIEGQAAEAAGMIAGDKILSINEEFTENWNDISKVIAASPAGASLRVMVERSGINTPVGIEVVPYFDEQSGRYLLGVLADRETMGFFPAVWLGIKQSVKMTVLIFQTLFGMITGTVDVELAGPVGVVSLVSETTQAGIFNVLFLTGFLCVNIGIFNLLPFPALDGSRLVFLAIEGIRRKPLDPKKEGMVHFVGLMLLFALMIFVTYQDIVRLIIG